MSSSSLRLLLVHHYRLLLLVTLLLVISTLAMIASGVSAQIQEFKLCPSDEISLNYPKQAVYFQDGAVTNCNLRIKGGQAGIITFGRNTDIVNSNISIEDVEMITDDPFSGSLGKVSITFNRPFIGGGDIRIHNIRTALDVVDTPGFAWSQRTKTLILFTHNVTSSGSIEISKCSITGQLVTTGSSCSGTGFSACTIEIRLAVFTLWPVGPYRAIDLGSSLICTDNDIQMTVYGRRATKLSILRLTFDSLRTGDSLIVARNSLDAFMINDNDAVHPRIFELLTKLVNVAGTMLIDSNDLKGTFSSCKTGNLGCQVSPAIANLEASPEPRRFGNLRVIRNSLSNIAILQSESIYSYVIGVSSSWLNFTSFSSSSSSSSSPTIFEFSNNKINNYSAASTGLIWLLAVRIPANVSGVSSLIVEDIEMKQIQLISTGASIRVAPILFDIMSQLDMAPRREQGGGGGGAGGGEIIFRNVLLHIVKFQALTFGAGSFQGVGLVEFRYIRYANRITVANNHLRCDDCSASQSRLNVVLASFPVPFSNVESFTLSNNTLGGSYTTFPSSTSTATIRLFIVNFERADGGAGAQDNFIYDNVSSMSFENNHILPSTSSLSQESVSVAVIWASGIVGFSGPAPSSSSSASFSSSSSSFGIFSVINCSISHSNFRTGSTATSGMTVSIITLDGYGLAPFAPPDSLPYSTQSPPVARKNFSQVLNGAGFEQVLFHNLSIVNVGAGGVASTNIGVVAVCLLNGAQLSGTPNSLVEVKDIKMNNLDIFISNKEVPWIYALKLLPFAVNISLIRLVNIDMDSNVVFSSPSAIPEPTGGYTCFYSAASLGYEFVRLVHSGSVLVQNVRVAARNNHPSLCVVHFDRMRSTGIKSLAVHDTLLDCPNCRRAGSLDHLTCYTVRLTRGGSFQIADADVISVHNNTLQGNFASLRGVRVGILNLVDAAISNLTKLQLTSNRLLASSITCADDVRAYILYSWNYPLVGNDRAGAATTSEINISNNIIAGNQKWIITAPLFKGGTTAYTIGTSVMWEVSGFRKIVFAHNRIENIDFSESKNTELELATSITRGTTSLPSSSSSSSFGPSLLLYESNSVTNMTAAAERYIILHILRVRGDIDCGGDGRILVVGNNISSIHLVRIGGGTLTLFSASTLSLGRAEMSFLLESISLKNLDTLRILNSVVEFSSIPFSKQDNNKNPIKMNYLSVGIIISHFNILGENCNKIEIRGAKVTGREMQLSDATAGGVNLVGAATFALLQPCSFQAKTVELADAELSGLHFGNKKGGISAIALYVEMPFIGLQVLKIDNVNVTIDTSDKESGQLLSSSDAVIGAADLNYPATISQVLVSRVNIFVKSLSVRKNIHAGVLVVRDKLHVSTELSISDCNVTLGRVLLSSSSLSGVSYVGVLIFSLETSTKLVFSEIKKISLSKSSLLVLSSSDSSTSSFPTLRQDGTNVSLFTLGMPIRDPDDNTRQIQISLSELSLQDDTGSDPDFSKRRCDVHSCSLLSIKTRMGAAANIDDSNIRWSITQSTIGPVSETEGSVVSAFDSTFSPNRASLSRKSEFYLDALRLDARCAIFARPFPHPTLLSRNLDKSSWTFGCTLPWARDPLRDFMRFANSTASKVVFPCDPLSETKAETETLTPSREITQPTFPPEELPRVSDQFVGSTNGLQGTNLAVSAAVSAVVPTLSFGVARQQAMLGYVTAAKSGSCRGIDESNFKPAAADSPTQMEVGSSIARYYIGGAVGNGVLTFSLILGAELLGVLYMKRTGSSSWNKPYKVFARCHVALVAFVFFSLLLAPTLTLGLVAVAQPKSIVSVPSKFLTILFCLLFLAAALYQTIWALYIRDRVEKYKLTKMSQQERAEQGKIKKLFSYWFEGPGEWVMPHRAPSSLQRELNEKDHLDFDAANPVVDGYNNRAPWFAVAEYAVQIGLALASLLAQVVPEKVSCVTQAVVLCVTLCAYLFLCLWLRPFQEKFNIIVMPVMTTIQLVIIIIVAAMGAEQPSWIQSLAVFSASMQSVVAIVVLLASFGPMMKPVLRVWQNLKRRTRGGGGGREEERRSNENRQFHARSALGSSLGSLLRDEDRRENAEDDEIEMQMSLRQQQQRRQQEQQPQQQGRSGGGRENQQQQQQQGRHQQQRQEDQRRQNQRREMYQEVPYRQSLPSSYSPSSSPRQHSSSSPTAASFSPPRHHHNYQQPQQQRRNESQPSSSSSSSRNYQQQYQEQNSRHNSNNNTSSNNSRNNDHYSSPSSFPQQNRSTNNYASSSSLSPSSASSHHYQQDYRRSNNSNNNGASASSSNLYYDSSQYRPPPQQQSPSSSRHNNNNNNNGSRPNPTSRRM